MGQETQYKKLSSWRQGLISNLNNQMDFPESALANGENLELSSGLRTRPGTEIISTGSLPVGEVVFSKQVRFPTNETSYLLCQVNEYTTPEPASPARFEHFAAWRSATNTMIVFGGLKDLDYSEKSFLNDVWEFNPNDSTWIQIVTTEGPTARRGSVGMYDEPNDRIIIFGGQTSDLSFSNEMWALDLSTATWELLETTGDVPDGRVHAFFMYGYSEGSLYIAMFGGDNRWQSNGEAFISSDYYTFSYDTLTWALNDYSWWGEATVDYPDRETNCGYAFVNNVLYMHGGTDAVEVQHRWNWRYNRGSDTWTKLENWPTLIGPTQQATVVTGDYMLSIWGTKDSVKVYDMEQDAWVDSSFSIDAPKPRLWPSAVLDNSGNVILFGGWRYDYSDPEYIENVTDDTFLVSYNPDTGVCDTTQVDIVVSGSDPVPYVSGSKLFASPTALPTTDAQFTQIYNLGAGAGTVSAAVLNDRVVITEGVNNPPLVWGGCMAADASDWAYPKQVLVTQDGDNFYDVSSNVLDKDPDNEANIGGISASGYLAICCDQPIVNGFYVEVKTPNTTTDMSQHVISLQYDFSDITYIDRENLIGRADRWKQRSGAFGYIEGAEFSLSGSAVDVGSGKVKLTATATGIELNNWVEVNGTTNYNGVYQDESAVSGDFLTITHAYVAEVLAGNIRELLGTSGDTEPFSMIEPGCLLETDGGDAQVISFVVGANGPEYMLDTELTNTDITAAYAVVVQDEKITLNHSVAETTFNATYITTSEKVYGPALQYNGFTVRNIVSGDAFGAGGNWVRITVGSSTFLPFWATPNGVKINKVSIVERDGDTASGTATPKEITFNTGQSGVTLTTGQTAISDAIPFITDIAKEYLIIIDVAKSSVLLGNLGNSGGPNIIKYDPWNSLPAYREPYGLGFYIKYDIANSPKYSVAPSSATMQTIDLFDGWVKSEGFSWFYGIAKIEVATTMPVPNNAQVFTTNELNQQTLAFAQGFSGVTISDTVPSGSNAFYAVSMDNQITFWIYNGDYWKPIIQDNLGTWEINDSTSETPNWTAATTNTKYAALRQAFSDTDNQVDSATWNALTAEWEDMFIPNAGQVMDWAGYLDSDGMALPVVNSIQINLTSLGYTTVETLETGGWTIGTWTDGTQSGGASLGQSGIVACNAGSSTADYGVVSGVPGYWFRFRTNGTSPDTSITRIMYKAPCQPLSNIGDGQLDKPIGFVAYDSVKGCITDFTVDVQDNNQTDIATVNLPLIVGDYLYIGGASFFNAVDISFYYPNARTASLTAEYWNGSAWTALTMTDNTAGITGVTFSTQGAISFTLPDDWKENIPFNTFMSRGYWIRLSVSDSLSADTSIAEVRLFPVPNSLPKYKFAETFGNRIALGNRPDAPDQVDISRQLEEYGFCGATSASYRLGGVDAVQCVVNAWNSLWVGKTEAWHRLTDSGMNSFSQEFIEAARHVPINSRVVVKAPSTGMDDGSKYSLFFINRYGAFASTGLQADSLFSTGRNMVLSAAVDWWQERTGSLPRLDLNYLHKAVGEYWPEKNWVIWSVPMIITEGQTTQTTNNRLIVFDISIGAWLPPFTITAASLCTGYSYNADCPGKLGNLMLFAGDYSGQVWRLFKPNQTTDNGTPIASWAETGWLHLGNPEIEKMLREVWLWGNTTTGGSDLQITSRLWRRQATVVTTTATKSFANDLDADNGLVGIGFEGGPSELANFFRFKLLFSDFADVYGLQFGFIPEREIGGT